MEKKMDKKTLEQYKKKLEEKRRELTEAYTKNRHYGRESDEGGTQDLADKAASSYTKEFLYSLSNTERSILEEVEKGSQFALASCKVSERPSRKNVA